MWRHEKRYSLFLYIRNSQFASNCFNMDDLKWLSERKFIYERGVRGHAIYLASFSLSLSPSCKKIYNIIRTYRQLNDRVRCNRGLIRLFLVQALWPSINLLSSDAIICLVQMGKRKRRLRRSLRTATRSNSKSLSRRMSPDFNVIS